MLLKRLKTLKLYKRLSSSYSNTVLLPKTKFPLKLEGKKLVERDDLLNNNESFKSLYSWQRANLNEPEFILHDGPPYANGAPHMGHAINKVLKDTILRTKLLNGQKVHYTPGWDCHGLPIELKALSSSHNLNPLEIRSKARNFASKTIEKQSKVFQSWGVMGDWNNPYKTFTLDYVENQFRKFYDLYDKKLVYRDFKPIYWSPSSRTALAEAELEYNEKHESTSVYVRFRIENVPKLPSLQDKTVYAIIWTTTPWTLPANQGVCYNKTLNYSIVKRSDPNDKDLYLVATELYEDLTQNCGAFDLLGVFEGEALESTTYYHPLNNEINKFYEAEHVTSTKGTGLVHTAPAHGPEDFLVALNHKIKVLDLVDNQGLYKETQHETLTGKFVLEEGQNEVLKLIKPNIIKESKFIHSYPYDWRTKKPVIIKASQQWFIDTNSIKSRAMQLLDKVQIIPKTSEIYKKNLMKQLEKRPYWCISRQRKWGVPIPVFYEQQNVIFNEEILEHYCKLLNKEGTDFWWKLPQNQLLPETLHKNSSLVKGEDIFDIWFDSGISWSKVLPGKQADLYLEGVDQFTGWFQSSLMTSVGIQDKAPYKSIYVHGFVVDENGVKMSKSLGNIVDPVVITGGSNKEKPLGVDTLRWWVVCHANQDSVAHVSKNVLQSSWDEVQKIRSCLRFALGSLNDFKPNQQIELLLIDKYLLNLLSEFHSESIESLNTFQFGKIRKLVLNLLTNQISALYYTSIKDRLYCETNNSRTAAQFVLSQIIFVICKVISPILPHLVEEIHSFNPLKTKDSFFKENLQFQNNCNNGVKIFDAMNLILELKRSVNKQVSSKLNSQICTWTISPQSKLVLEEVINLSPLEQELIDVLQVSDVKIVVKNDLQEQIHLSETSKSACPRCRRYHSDAPQELCLRCTKILSENKNSVVNYL